LSTAPPRLIALVCALLAAGFASFLVVRRSFSIAPGEGALAQGMRWLKHEYHLDEETYAKVVQAHQSYYRECSQRCGELEELNRHFLSEVESPKPTESDLDAVQELQEAICHECRMAMVEHVHEVAALMPETSGRRFLADAQRALSPPARPKSGRGRR
jgi:hypothetical protein